MDNIYNIEIPFYKNELPEIHNNVLVVFTKHHDTYIEAKLLEYNNIFAIMTYDNATRRKKVYERKKELPLNKPTVATVEQIISSNYVQLTILNLKKDESVMKPFLNNKILINIIKKLCTNLNLNFNEFWTNIIYNINLDDIINDQEEINNLIVKYYNNNELSVVIIDKLNKLLNYKTIKLQTRIQLISHNINDTITLLELVQNTYNWLNPIKYESESIYLFESILDNSIKNHDELIEFIKLSSYTYNIEFKII
jgi:hypothetical protein